MKNIFSKYKGYILMAVTVIVFYAILFALGITCPIKYITGVSCPGCGMSRACMSALRFDFASAFYYHPLWIMLPPAIALLIVFKAIKKPRLFNITLYVCATVMFFTWLYRMIFLNTEIVVFALDEGIVARIIQWIAKK